MSYMGHKIDYLYTIINFGQKTKKEVNGTAEVENYFGYALLGGDYDNNRLDDLVIGSPL